MIDRTKHPNIVFKEEFVSVTRNGQTTMIQCIANLVMGLADLRARKLLMRSDDSDN